MSYFPIFVDLQNRRCLIIGGGKVALRKAKSLLEYGANVTLVAPTVLPEFQALDVTIQHRKFTTKDLTNVFLVVTATDDTSLNQAILDTCKAKNILCNSATHTTGNGYIFPAVAHLRDITVGVSTSGRSPYVSKLIRLELIQDVLPKYSTVVELSSTWRTLVAETVSNVEARSNIVRHLIDYSLTEGIPSKDKILQIIEKFR